jgi:hypothetical protein
MRRDISGDIFTAGDPGGGTVCARQPVTHSAATSSKEEAKARAVLEPDVRGWRKGVKDMLYRLSQAVGRSPRVKVLAALHLRNSQKRLIPKVEIAVSIAASRNERR